MLNTGWFWTRGRAWSSVAIDACIAAYAAWTVSCHAVMLLGGNTYTLARVASALLACALVAGVIWFVRLRGGQDTRAADATPAPVPAEPPAPPPQAARFETRERAVLVALGVGVLGVWLLSRDLLALWYALAAYALVVFALELRAPPPPISPTDDTSARWQEWVVWGASLLFAFLALYAHRWRNDDCYYVNLAVTTADQPWLPLLSTHTVHLAPQGFADANAVFPPYRVHSFEALGGLLAFATGFEAINVMHIGMTAVAAFLMPLAYARLFRLLDPERFVWMLLVVVLFFTFEGSGDRGFSNQAFVRAFTGKSVMLNVAVPALACYGIALGRQPSLRALLLFTAAEISAIGLSSTALWLGPMVGMVAVAVPLALRVRSVRTLLLGLLGCAYVIALALWIRGQMIHAAADEELAHNAVAIVTRRFVPKFEMLDRAFHQNMGPASMATLYVAMMVLAVPLCRTALARRYLAFFYLVLVLLLTNPYLISFLAHNVLGPSTAPRAMWFAPMPAAVAIVFTAVIPSVRAGFERRAFGVGAMLVAVTLLLVIAPTRYVLSSRNNVEYHWPPRPKVPSGAFKLVLRLRKMLPENAIVLAPPIVSWYLPTVRNHPYPLLANAKYMRSSPRDEGSRKELVKALARVGKGSDRKAIKRLVRGMSEYDVDAVVLNRRSVASDVKAALRKAGYRHSKQPSQYDLWVRRRGKAKAEAKAVTSASRGELRPSGDL
jgi:hypothetical protein